MMKTVYKLKQKVEAVPWNINMDREIFEKEIALCRMLSKKNGGKCAWGECSKCGVIPLLYKLHKKIVVEKDDEVIALKAQEFE